MSSMLSVCCGHEGSEPALTPRQSIYEEAMEMLTGSLLIYTFAELREMARRGELSCPQSDLEPPMTCEHMIEVITDNRDALEKRAIKHEELEERLQSLKNIKEHEGSIVDNMLSHGKHARLARFEDENATKEMVHAIVINDARKRITVVFRGSVTQKDFIIDAKCNQKKVDNPVAHLVEYSTPTVNVHAGFYQYLFKKDGSGLGRLERILQDVKALLREKPGYRLYCTGHSLGGALSTLCGFYAAAEEEIVKGGSVTIVSIASPLVGNMKFRLAFQTLERLKRLQHLRIANKEDLVTVIPFMAPKVTALSPVLAAAVGGGNLYKHCGMRLKLKSALDCDDARPYSIVYSKDNSDEDANKEERKHAVAAGKSLVGSLGLLVKKDFEKVQAYHSCDEYEARLETCKKYLSFLTLDDLYQNKDVVGNVLDEDYKPDISISSSGQALLNASGRAVKALKSARRNSKIEPDDDVSEG